MSKKLGGAAKHTPAELVTRLIRLFTRDCADKTATAAEDTGAFDWHVCGSHVAKHFAEAPAASFMNGPMDAQVKLRAAHRRRRDEPLGPVTTADAVDDTNAEQQTDHAMKRMVRVMKERKSKKETLTMEELAVNPASFAQFVENVFTLSFLVKDGEAGLALPEAREPEGSEGSLRPVVKKTRKPEENLDVERATFVMHLDVAGWRALTTSNGGRAGAMPHRETATTKSARRRAGRRLRARRRRRRARRQRRAGWRRSRERRRARSPLEGCREETRARAAAGCHEQPGGGQARRRAATRRRRSVTARGARRRKQTTTRELENDTNAR